MNSTSVTSIIHSHEKHLHAIIPVLIFLSILVIVGIPGNMLILYVNATRFKPGILRCFILMMGLLDLAICTVDIPMELFNLVYVYAADTVVHPALCKVFHLCHNVLCITSMYMLVGVAVERFLKVCKPFRKQLNIRAAKITCGVSCGSAVVLAVPSWFIYGSAALVSDGVALNITRCGLVDDRNAAVFTFNWGFWILQDVGVFLTLIILYSMIWRKVCLQSAARSNLQTSRRVNTRRKINSVSISIVDSNPGAQTQSSTFSSSDKDSSDKPNISRLSPHIKCPESRDHGVQLMTKVMFGITLVGLLSYIPIVIKTAITIADSEFDRMFTENLSWFYFIFVRTYYIQYSSNFLVYSFCSPQFRGHLKDIMRQIRGH